MQNPLYDRLVSLIADVGALASVAELLHWDQDVTMPKSPDGEGVTVQIRAKELGALAAVTHEKFTSPEIGRLLGRLSEDETLNDDQRALVKEVSFDYRRATCVPPDFVRREAELFARANGVWEVARAGNDFTRFSALLNEVFDLARERARLIDPDREPYAVLFEGYESGIPLDEVRDHFARIRDAIIPVIASLKGRPPVDDAFLNSPVPEAAQLAFHRSIAALLGYDFTRGRIDTTVHPFSGAFGRVSTRFTDGPAISVLSTVHEVGHAMYEHNCVTKNLQWFGTPLAQSRSLGVHESQSRLWENHVGKGESFWRHAYPLLQAAFGRAFASVPLDRFIAAINKAEPGLIRVNADELTYPMHVFLRFEIEQDVLSGRLAVGDIPQAWNAKMQEYLGITPPNDAKGCLQDVHWSIGAVGYFPTYVIGSMLAAQEYAAAKRDIPDLDGKIASGDTKPLQDWLRVRIHEPACRYQTKELIRRATGKDPSPDDYIAYLKEKFG